MCDDIEPNGHCGSRAMPRWRASPGGTAPSAGRRGSVEARRCIGYRIMELYGIIHACQWGSSRPATRAFTLHHQKHCIAISMLLHSYRNSEELPSNVTVSLFRWSSRLKFSVSPLLFVPGCDVGKMGNHHISPSVARCAWHGSKIDRNCFGHRK